MRQGSVATYLLSCLLLSSTLVTSTSGNQDTALDLSNHENHLIGSILGDGRTYNSTPRPLLPLEKQSYLKDAVKFSVRSLADDKLVEKLSLSDGKEDIHSGVLSSDQDHVKTKPSTDGDVNSGTAGGEMPIILPSVHSSPPQENVNKVLDEKPNDEPARSSNHMKTCEAWVEQSFSKLISTIMIMQEYPVSDSSIENLSPDVLAYLVSHKPSKPSGVTTAPASGSSATEILEATKAYICSPETGDESNSQRGAYSLNERLSPLTGGILPQFQRNSLYISQMPFGDKFSKKLEQYSGHIVVGEKKVNTIFFWLVKAAHQVGKKKLMFWFNGGPGCSSMTGALSEVGPFKFKYRNSTFVFEENVADITHHASVVFVDHPPGTGLSIMNTKEPFPQRYDEWISMIIEFFTKFMTMFPEFTGADVYLTGESYSGFYLPHFANGIFENIDSIPGLETQDIKGIIVGNPWFDPISHYTTYYQFVKDRGILPDKLLSELKQFEDKCLNQAIPKYKNWEEMVNDDNFCSDIYINKVPELSKLANTGNVCMNIYDIKLTDPGCGMNWPDSINMLSSYFALPESQKNLHISLPGIPIKAFDECAGIKDNPKLNDIFRSSKPGIYMSSKLLTKYEQFKVIIFEGDDDFICNSLGMAEALKRVRINDSAEGLEKFDKYKWLIEDKEIGKHYKYANLEYYLITGGSHMPAVESPKAVYDIYLRSTGIEGEGFPSSMVKLNGDNHGTRKIRNYVTGAVLGVSSLSIVGILWYRISCKKKYVVANGDANKPVYDQVGALVTTP